jgi:DNA-binding NarL/FixJ family response regulator
MNPNRLTTIGIVEDNAAFRKTLMALIDATPGFRCICASGSAEDALVDVPKHRPDVVLMDIHLPGESGIACTARLTAQMAQLQVIMLTVYKDTKLIFQALKAGACGYVLKRSRPEEILDAISEVRRGGAPMTSEIARLVVRSFKAEEAAANQGSEAEGLSGREAEILVLLSEGLSNKEIGARLSISAATVRSHLMNIFKKLHVHCRTEAAAKYLRQKSAPV